ncbi:hypothetical protein GN958_ATG16693 [Phytophthora infestans]|uniref:Uncharacterized protein n=1 Tax=Phytophthora infestans TaxID=4787 RepID=A0A8S9U4M3_PHYIN|nr:hypothetical protein GN958_ATG16693 [Phytophthora infestans]
MQLEDAVRLDLDGQSILVQTNQVQVVVEPRDAAILTNPALADDQPNIRVLPLDVTGSTSVVNNVEGDTVARHNVSPSVRKTDKKFTAG